MTAEEIKTLTGSQDYYDRYEDSNGWRRIAFLAGRAIQSAEFNELQHIFDAKIKALGNAMYTEGAIIEGCTASYSPQDRTITLEGGRVALDGIIFTVDEAELTLQNDDDVQIGVRLNHDCITEYDDFSLLDPAKGYPQYKMPGGYRITTNAEWGLSSDDEEQEFFPLYEFSDGGIVSRVSEFTNTEYLEIAARYDRHAHGHYIVEGLKVTPLSGSPAGKQIFSISEGEAHIHGYETVIPCSVRVVADESPDLADIESEVHKYTPTSGSMQIQLNHTPVETIGNIRATKERTVSITHGNYSGCTDELPDTSIFEIVSVKQDDKVFVDGTDFYFISDKINWSLNNDEPAPYSTYDVTYHYRANVTPDSYDKYSVTLSGLVDGSLTEIDYSYRMPRKDILVIYRNGSAGIVRGVSHRYAPVRPSTPPEAICLAEISQTWDGLPVVSNIAPHCVSIETLNSMQKQIAELYSMAAILMRKSEAPSGAFNIFVDPLLDDSTRDKGTNQTAVISNGMLGISAEKNTVSLTLQNDAILDYENEALIKQEKKTYHKMNNSQKAFGLKFDAMVTLTPPSDRLTDENGFLRQITVNVKGEGFSADEAVSVIFDGVEVDCTSENADSQGIFSGDFTIPAGIPSGVKLVQLKGTQNKGSAYFWGIQEAKDHINYNIAGREYAPYAQTFTLSETRIVTGADFVCHKDEGKLRVEIREAVSGIPTQTVLTSGTVESQALSREWCTVMFDSPVLLSAGNEYALTFYSDAGVFHLDYAINCNVTGGQFLCSNNKKWTVQKKGTLTFRLLCAGFNTSIKTIPLGTVSLSGVTDITPLAEVLRTGNDTDATFILKKGNSEIARMQSWQKQSFTTPLDGDYSFDVEIHGDEKLSPIVGRCPQILAEKIALTGDYVSRAFSCGNGRRVMVSTDEYVPAGASVNISVETENDIWTEAENTESEILGEGWIRYKRYVPCNMETTRLKIILNGTASARPLIQNISAVILNA